MTAPDSLPLDERRVEAAARAIGDHLDDVGMEVASPFSLARAALAAADALGASSQDAAAAAPSYESPNHFDGFDDMLADLERVIQELRVAVSPNSKHIAQVERVGYELRHVVQYARDGEAGQRILRERLSAYEAPADAAPGLRALLLRKIENELNGEWPTTLAEFFDGLFSWQTEFDADECRIIAAALGAPRSGTEGDG